MKTTESLRPSPTALLNPRLDVNFKAIFTQGTKSSDTALKSLLEASLNRKITSFFLEPNEPAVENASQMQMSFDIAVTFDDGEKADIEMQTRDREYEYAFRTEGQVARLLNNNVKKGDKWHIEKVYQISILNFSLEICDKEQVSWYTMKNKNGTELASRMNVIFIDLPQIKKLYGTSVEELTPIQKWGLYLSYADDESKREYIDKIVKSEEGIMEADRIAGVMSEEDANWFRQNSIDTFWLDYNSDIYAATEKGIKQGARQSAINLLKMNILSDEQISQAIGLPLEQVLKLKEEISVEA